MMMKEFLSNIDKQHLSKHKKECFEVGLLFLLGGILFAVFMVFLFGMRPRKIFDWRVLPYNDSLFFNDFIFLYSFPLAIALYNFWRAFSFWVDLENDQKLIVDTIIIEKDLKSKEVMVEYLKRKITLSEMDIVESYKGQKVKVHLAYFSRKILKLDVWS